LRNKINLEIENPGHYGRGFLLRFSLQDLIHHSPFTIHHSPFTIHHSPFTIHHSPLTTHHSPLTTHHSPLTIHHHIASTLIISTRSLLKLAFCFTTCSKGVKTIWPLMLPAITWFFPASKAPTAAYPSRLARTRSA
jgi:hypothetical protein